MRLGGVVAVFKDYLLNSSFHGLRFIADDELHMTERIFWFICVLFSWFGSIMLILASVDSFLYNAISFGMETTYKDWDTCFPAVAVCENINEPKLYEVADSIWTLDHAIDLEEVLKEVVYFRGYTYYSSHYCGKPDADEKCPHGNLSYYTNLVRSPCKDIITDCVFNEEAFDCCTFFKTIETDTGKCFIVNSDQKALPGADHETEMVSNRRQGPGLLTFKVLIPANIYTLGNEEVPAVTTMQALFFGVNDPLKYRRHLTVRNLENDPLLRGIDPSKRNCRYSDENFLEVYPKYSRSACIVQCRKNWQRKFCNCTSHFMPNTKPEEHCDLDGLVCLNGFSSELSVLKPAWAQRKGLVCECPQSCSEDEISVIKDDKLQSESGLIEVEIIMEYLPSERYKRNVVRSRLDLVVSTGGTTGLFVGASLLSFVELFYFLIIRYYGTVYMKIRKLREAISKANNMNDKKTVIVKFFTDSRRVPVINIKRTRNDFRKAFDTP